MQMTDRTRHADTGYRKGHGRQRYTVVTAMPVHPPSSRAIANEQLAEGRSKAEGGFRNLSQKCFQPNTSLR